MKVTKFVHSCLLVETDGRTALFDPGLYSESALDINRIERLDDILITHEHGDHFSLNLVKQVVQKFPQVRITGTQPVVDQLAEAGIKASSEPSEGVVFFESPHESIAPLIATPPPEIGYHYLDSLSHPGDSHSFKETKAVLALPVQAPWGSSARAVSVALELKPKHVLPIHDWHWRDEAREQMYGRFEQIFNENGIKFYKLQTGQPVEVAL